MVNAEVKERVFSKESNSYYLGCYEDSKRSSCYTMMANNIPIKYSEVYTDINFYHCNKKKKLYILEFS